MRIYAPLQKIDEEQRMVYGYASTEALDSQGEIIKRDAIEAALPGFMRFGNIREMHQPSAVGKAKDAMIDDKGLYLAAKIIDDDAWAKVKAGVYSGFSVAGQVTARDPMQKHVITGCQLSEISLVDRPSNPEAVFEMFKSAAPIDPMQKAGRRNSKADLSHIQAIHDHAASLGADCAGCAAAADAAPDDQGDADDTVAKLARTLGKLTEDYARLAARIGRIEDHPAPARGNLRAIAKHEDLGRYPADEPADTNGLIKAALARPRIF
jgi:phage head maturation protease